MMYSPLLDYDSSPVVVARFANVFEAYLAADALADADIGTQVRTLLTSPHPLFEAGVTLSVLEPRVVEAQALLTDVVPEGRAWIIPEEEARGIAQGTPEPPSLLFAAAHYFWFAVAAAVLFGHPSDTPFDSVLGFYLGSLALAVRGGYLVAAQRWRDYLAGLVVSEVDHRPFTLFLRPFLVTNRLGVLRRVRQFFTSMILIRNDVDTTIDFETLLRGATDKEHQLVGLGKPGEAIGAGRVAVEDAVWRETLTPLVDRAQEIYVIPGSRPGILWELGLLRDRGALRKSIFIMPPELTAAQWRECVELAAAIPYRLPRYDHAGRFFTIEDDGVVGADVRLGTKTIGGIRRALRRLRSLRDATPAERAASARWERVRFALAAVTIVTIAAGIAYRFAP